MIDGKINSISHFLRMVNGSWPPCFCCIPLIILWMTTPLVSQSFYFEKVPSDLGLSQHLITEVIQDSQGFLWVGTKDGLNRFDGYQFKVFRNDPFDTTTLSNNYINCLWEDRHGRIWVGTQNGLNLYDRNRDQFSRILPGGPWESSPAHHIVRRIREGADGGIWIGYWGGGLDRLWLPVDGDGLTKLKIDHFRAGQLSEGELSENFILDIMEGPDGGYWVDTRRQLHQLRYEPELNRWSFRLFDDPRLALPFRNWLRDGKKQHRTFTGQKGRKWIGIGPHLICWDSLRQQYEYFEFPEDHPVRNFPGWWDVTRSYCEDHTGNIWIGTLTGLDCFMPATGRYLNFGAEADDPNPYFVYGVTSLFEDHSGILWIGSNGNGLYKKDDKSRRFADNGLMNGRRQRLWQGESIRSLALTRDGSLWIGPATTGLFQVDRQNGNMEAIELPAALQKDGWGVIYSITEDRQGQLWAAGDKGLYHLRREGGKVAEVRLFDPTPTDGTGYAYVMFDIEETRQGELWVAAGSQLYRFDRYREQLQSFPYVDPVSGEALIAEYACIHEGDDGFFWVGTNQGLLRFDPGSGTYDAFRNDPKVPTSISNNSVRSICADPTYPDRYLWIGTAGGGLNRFDKETGVFTHFTMREGLPDNVIYAVLSDEDGLLWLSTNNGICRFSPTLQTCRNYDIQDGLQNNEFNTGAYFKSQQGELFFGGISGYNAFFPGEIRDNPYRPPVVITDFWVNDHLEDYRLENSPLEAPVSEVESIVLPPQVKVFSIGFVALDFSAPQKNRYAYKLENFDEDWLSAGNDRRATYTNLDPGDYVFRVRGTNNDGIWNNRPATLRITIRPPWWKTWWAYLIYSLIVIGLVLGMRRYEIDRQRLRHSLELEILEAEKLKEVDQLKSRFFANISHEFRTPLTLILGQVDSVMTSLRSEKEKARLGMAFRNARRLLKLINQLLDLSKLEAGSMELKAAKGDIVQFLRNLFYSFESVANRKEIAMEFRTTQEEVELYFEAEKLEKVFFNLLANAFKFTDEGGTIAVEVELEDEAAAGPGRPSVRWLTVHVRDTGIGIPAERLPHIFDRFVQADSSSTRSQDGTGIGLALARELIELHHGHIRVSSEEGHGSIFTVQLPLGRGHLQAGQIVQKASLASEQQLPHYQSSEELLPYPSEGAAPAPYGSTEKIKQPIVLIVEDNADVRFYLADHLEDHYRVVEAANGEDGLGKARELLPDLIVTDLMMPRFDGYSLTRALRDDTRTSHIPVIMLTARAAEEDRIEGLQAGVDDYLVKPFSPRELLARVENLIRLRRQLRERFSGMAIIKPAEVSAIPLDQAFLEKVISAIEKNIGDEAFGAEKLAVVAGMSTSNLNRKLNALIDQPAGQLIRTMRLQRAAELLEREAGSISEIAYQVGFRVPAHFSRSFKQQFGCSPSEFQRKH